MDIKASKDLISLNKEPQFKEKVFLFFYLILRKTDINLFSGCFLLSIETIQLISYSFSDPHLNSWNVSEKIMYYVNKVVGATRITPLFIYLKFYWYLIIWATLLGYVFFHCVLIAFVIKFNRVNSSFYKIGCSLTRYFSSVFTIIGIIPFMETMLLMVKCNSSNEVDILLEPIVCYAKLHILYTVLTFIFAICLFFLIMLSAVFYFDPFNSKSATTKINPSADVYFYIAKVVLVLRYIFIKEEWISIIVMLIISTLIIKKCLDDPSYKSYALQCFISIRNVCVLWTALMLLLCKLCEGSSYNGNIFLLLFGFPIIILTCIVYYKSQHQRVMVTSTNIVEINDFLLKLKNLVRLVENYINRNKSLKSNKKEYNKNDIYLQGYITLHNETCILEECPLLKFTDNIGHFAIQKTCLLHYVNILFVEGIKNFPNSRRLIMMFIQFNYQNQFNLNAARTFLAKIEKESNSISEDYLIFCIQQLVNSQSARSLPVNRSESDDMMKVEESIEQKFRKLKTLIESTTKLYGEFWGILATNLSNNLNLNKLYFIGNKLNEFLEEIHVLWEKELRNKKIELENQSIVQLYIYFIREILRNKAKSEEIAKKLNEEQFFESKKAENDRFDLDNLDVILESQECIVFSRTNDKGESTIIQCSNSIVSLLGYTKQDLIGQKIEIMMPGLFIEGHAKLIQAKIKSIRGLVSSDKANDKKTMFILPKSKVGYLIPINVKLRIYNDDDFSNTFIFKSKFENKDAKTVYAFYILAKEDLTIDSFSSSALVMGLTMDLLKKYVVNMNYLVRSVKGFEPLNILEHQAEFEEEPTKVAWIFPDKIYPKNDSSRNKEENIEKLIMESESKRYNLLVTRMKFSEDETIGFCFRFTDPEPHKKSPDGYDIAISSSRFILYDMLKLHFIRTAIVQSKSKEMEYVGRSSLRRSLTPLVAYSAPKKACFKKKKKESAYLKRMNKGDDVNEDEEENKAELKAKEEENALNKEKIIEYTAKGSDEIREYIEVLPFYGKDIQLEKHRPNKERYPTGKFSEPLIKISVAFFVKRINDKVKARPDFNRDKKYEAVVSSYEPASSSSQSQPSTSSAIGVSLLPQASSSSSNDSSTVENSNASMSLSQIFHEKSVIYIKIFSMIMFCIISAMISFEFAISYQLTRNSSERIGYVDKSFTILNALLYTKFFITEAILAQDAAYPNINSNTATTQAYISAMITELSFYRQVFSGTYSYFSNATVPFSAEYRQYISNTLLTVRTLSNNQSITELIPFAGAMGRIPSSIFYVSVINDNNVINMSDRNAYELMMNLLNDYLLGWRNATFILVSDTKSNAVISKLIIFSYGFSFLISVVSLVSLWKLINRFIDDREKPVNLFLTIKKNKFEELKTSSEGFLNKLLNKFFGNEETEEESLVEYSSTIKADDIMINKFKQKTEYKQSVRTSSEYLLSLIKMAVFFIGMNIYMSFKYFYMSFVMQDINEFTNILNITHYSQGDIILTANIFKSFYFNSSIPILNSSNTQQEFDAAFETMTDIYKKIFSMTAQTNTFLTGSYADLFYKNMYGDISALTTNRITSTELNNAVGHGFASVCSSYFELHRFVALLYYKAPNDRFCYKKQYFEINESIQNVLRPWYDNLIKNILINFKNYFDKANLIQVTMFVILLVGIIILYFFVWKAYEEKLKVLLKTSVDLIKLIPEEIKKEIVKKLNEEEEKKE